MVPDIGNTWKHGRNEQFKRVILYGTTYMFFWTSQMVCIGRMQIKQSRWPIYDDVDQCYKAYSESSRLEGKWSGSKANFAGRYGR